MQGFNFIGMGTLYKREVWRFMKVWNQTLIAPVVTTLLFLAILTLALGGAERHIGELPFPIFITPGLIMMAVVQNAFANTSSSFMLQKFQGVIIDLLMPPLSAFEITFSMMMGGITRGVLVGITVSAAMTLFVPVGLHSPALALYYIFASSMMLAALGLIIGIWAETFDQMAAITNYIITPLSFLSGTFYSIHFLPSFWHQVSLMNPFFYMIDGFRYALTGYSDGDIMAGVWVLLLTNIALWLAAHYLLKSGWRLKS